MDKSTSKRKEREKEARHEAILNAAARIFSEKSYYAATLDEIASEAELAKGTLYNYFKDKQDIFASLIQRGQDEFIEALQRPRLPAETLIEFIGNVIHSLLALMGKNKYLERMVLTSGGHLSESVQSELMKNWWRAVEEATWILADNLGELPETTAVPRDERYVAAVLMMSSAHAIYHRQLPIADSMQVGVNVELYVNMICRALQTEKRT